MDEFELKRNLGAKIKEARVSQNLTQEQFSEKIGITQRQMSLIELGKSFPSPKTISNIINVLNCSIKSLFDFNDIENNINYKIEVNALLKKLPKEKIKILYNIAKNI